MPHRLKIVIWYDLLMPWVTYITDQNGGRESEPIRQFNASRQARGARWTAEMMAQIGPTRFPPSRAILFVIPQKFWGRDDIVRISLQPSFRQRSHEIRP